MSRATSKMKHCYDMYKYLYSLTVDHVDYALQVQASGNM